MIREAGVADLPALVRMGRDFHAATIEDSPFVAEDFEASLRAYLDGSDWCVLIDGERRGFLVGLVFADYWNASTRRASELMWWVEPQSRGGRLGLRFLGAFAEWARSNGAGRLVLAQRANMKAYDRFYKRAGLRPVETYFVGAL